jgi:hypothetical protein
MNDDDEFDTKVQAKLKELMPLLHGVDGDVAGAVLGYMVATWVAGHPLDTRGEVRESHDVLVDSVIEWIDGNLKKKAPKRRQH